MFIGSANATIDAKGRIKFPARLCEQITQSGESNLVIALHPNESCLVLYPLSDWEQTRHRVNELPSLDEGVKLISRRLIQCAVECELNNTQRILIPSNLRKLVGLNKAVSISAGAGQFFEIWDEQLWDEKLQQSTQMSEAVKEFRL